jgi:UDP-3-O-[3-hydroxymyristoyl] glucosamine N-acyltransferase
MKFASPLKASVIAERFNAKLIGSQDKIVTGLNEIHNVEAGDITFVDHPKYYSKTLSSTASVIVINQEPEELPKDKVLILHNEPFELYTSLSKEMRPSLFGDDTKETSRIGENTWVASTAFIGQHVTIGKDCQIHPGVVIYPYSVIGDRVIIHANTVVGADAFYYKKSGTNLLKMHTAGDTLIEDDVEIGPCCTIDAGVSATTKIGRGTKLDAQIHIGHDVVIGEDCVFAAQVGIAGNVKIGNRVTFLGKSGSTKNVIIGDDVVIMGASQVGKSLESGKSYLGTPAAELRTVAKEWAMIKRLPDLWDKIKHL